MGRRRCKTRHHRFEDMKTSMGRTRRILLDWTSRSSGLLATVVLSMTGAFARGVDVPSITANTIQFSAMAYEIGETNPAVVLFVQRAGDLSVPAAVGFASSGGTATAGADYTETAGTLVFSPGETERSVVVPILNDATVESPEVFTVALANPTGDVVLGTRATATVRIVSNDTPLGFEFGTYRSGEDADSVVLGVRRGDDGDFPATVDFRTEDQTATNGVDYVASQGTLTFAPGETLRLVTVAILNDGEKESVERFQVVLSNPTAGAVLGARRIAAILIADNDPGVRFARQGHWGPEYFVEESKGAVTITVLRGSDDASRSFTVDFATADRTAKAGMDYSAVQGQLSFNPGRMQATLTVPVLADDLVEGDEEFVVVLSNLTEGTFLGGPTTVAVELFDSTGEVPHRLDGISVTPDGGAELKLGGASPYEDDSFHALFPIEVSHDLENWQPRVTLIRTNVTHQPFAWTDAEAGSTERRFYRTPAGTAGSLLTPFASRPTGPFPVGVQWRRLTDPARRNRYEVSTNSSFMVSVWYPAVPRAGQVPALVWDPRFWPYIVTHASKDAPSATDGAPWPVVLYSHGFQNDRGSASEKGPELASHGYVVVAVDHYDSSGSVFPDGSYYQTTSPSLDETGLQDRVADGLFVLDELSRWNREDPVLAGKLNTNAVAAMGFSFGGVTSAELARIQSRCKVAVLLDPAPSYPTQLSSSGIGKPMLQINAFDRDEVALFSRATTDAIWFKIRGSVHLSMGGQDYEWSGTPAYLRDVREARRTVNAYALAFLNRHLKGLEAPLLDAPSNAFPRIVNWRKK